MIQRQTQRDTCRKCVELMSLTFSCSCGLQKAGSRISAPDRGSGRGKFCYERLSSWFNFLSALPSGLLCSGALLSKQHYKLRCGHTGLRCLGAEIQRDKQPFAQKQTTLYKMLWLRLTPSEYIGSSPIDGLSRNTCYRCSVILRGQLKSCFLGLSHSKTCPLKVEAGGTFDSWSCTWRVHCRPLLQLCFGCSAITTDQTNS